jgi:hypothetical protein
VEFANDLQWNESIESSLFYLPNRGFDFDYISKLTEIERKLASKLDNTVFLNESNIKIPSDCNGKFALKAKKKDCKNFYCISEGNFVNVVGYTPLVLKFPNDIERNNLIKNDPENFYKNEVNIIKSRFPNISNTNLYLHLFSLFEKYFVPLPPPSISREFHLKIIEDFCK